MIQSLELTLSNAQNLSQTAAAYASTNIIDRGATGTPHGGQAALASDLGAGNPVPFEVIVDQTFTSGGAATLSVALQVDDNSSFSSAKTVKTSKTWALADLVVGANIFPDCFIPTDTDERYVRLLYTIGTATTTAGTVSAFVSGGRQTNQ